MAFIGLNSFDVASFDTFSDFGYGNAFNSFDFNNFNADFDLSSFDAASLGLFNFDNIYNGFGLNTLDNGLVF